MTSSCQRKICPAFVSEMLQGFDAIVRSSASRSRRSIGRMATSASSYWARRVSGSRWGAGTLPLTMVSLPVFVRARAVDRSRLGSSRSRRRRLSVLASGKPPSALRSQIVSPSQVISKTPPVPGASHLAEIGPERREQLLREPGRAQEPATLRTIANGDPWSEVTHQGLLAMICGSV